MIDLWFGDGIDGMLSLPAKSVDCIICDPPYGMTRNAWDVPIPLDRLWAGIRHCIKPDGAVLVFGLGLFAARLALSNEAWWRYKWIWEKISPTGFLNAKKAPLRTFEEIHVFYDRPPVYNPQKTQGHPPVHSFTRRKLSNGPNYGGMIHETSGGGNTDRYPRDVIRFSLDKQKSAVHGTQKPLELLRYFVRTYTRPGETLLDPTAGSGTAGIAAAMEGREAILFENDRRIFTDATERILAFQEIFRQDHGEKSGRAP